MTAATAMSNLDGCQFLNGTAFWFMPSFPPLVHCPWYYLLHGTTFLFIFPVNATHPLQAPRIMACLISPKRTKIISHQLRSGSKYFVLVLCSFFSPLLPLYRTAHVCLYLAPLTFHHSFPFVYCQPHSSVSFFFIGIIPVCNFSSFLTWLSFFSRVRK